MRLISRCGASAYFPGEEAAHEEPTESHKNCKEPACRYSCVPLQVPDFLALEDVPRIPSSKFNAISQWERERGV